MTWENPENAGEKNPECAGTPNFSPLPKNPMCHCNCFSVRRYHPYHCYKYHCHKYPCYKYHCYYCYNCYCYQCLPLLQCSRVRFLFLHIKSFHFAWVTMLSTHMPSQKHAVRVFVFKLVVRIMDLLWICLNFLFFQLFCICAFFAYVHMCFLHIFYFLRFFAYICICVNKKCFIEGLSCQPFPGAHAL